MSSIITNLANTILAKHRFEIEGCINSSVFFRAKFDKDLKDLKRIRKNLYKKIKK